MPYAAEIYTPLYRKESDKPGINGFTAEKRQHKNTHHTADHTGDHKGGSYKFTEIGDQRDSNENCCRDQEENCCNGVFVQVEYLHSISPGVSDTAFLSLSSYLISITKAVSYSS